MLAARVNRPMLACPACSPGLASVAGACLQPRHKGGQRLVVHAPAVGPKLEQQLQVEQAAGGKAKGRGA